MEDPSILFTIKVKIKGSFLNLPVRGSDQPFKLAEKFGQKYKLDQDQCLKLATSIQQSIEAYIELQNAPPKRNVGAELYRKGTLISRKKEQRILAQRVRLQQKELDGATFQPTLTASSKRYKGSKRRLSLYSKAQIKQQFSQKPLTNVCKSTASLETILKSSRRLHDNGKILQIRRQQRIKEQDEQIKREYFVPKIGRGPLSTSPRKRLTDLEQPHFKPNISTYSTYLHNSVKRRTIHSIFSGLNPDQGRIYYANIDFDELPQYILRLLSPFFDQLELIKQGISIEDFTIAMKNLIKTLSPTEKDELLNPIKFIRSESQTIRKGSSQRIGTLYERCMSNKRGTEQKINADREKMVKEEIAECTFKPKTTTYKPVQSITKILFLKAQKALGRFS